MSEPMVTYFADEYTMARLTKLEAENATLRERIEQLEYMEARSAAEAKYQRNRAEFWKGEAQERAGLLVGLEWAGADVCGDAVCPDCGWERRDPDEIKRMVADGIRVHDPDCDLVRLMTMPDEPNLTPSPPTSPPTSPSTLPSGPADE